MNGIDHAAARCDREGHCVTCADEGVPMRVVGAGPEDGVAVCEDAGGHRSDVMTGLVGEVAVGDRLLVHAGAALIRLDPTGAA